MALAKDRGLPRKRVVILRGAVQRQLAHEADERGGARQQRAELRLRAVGEEPAGGHVDLPDAVVADEQVADVREVGTQERLSAGEVQVLDRPQLAREGLELVEGQVVAAVQAPPVEAVLAGEVADRVDEEDQERRRVAGTMTAGGPGEPRVASHPRGQARRIQGALIVSPPPAARQSESMVASAVRRQENCAARSRPRRARSRRRS